MKINSMVFYEPVINEEKCVHCGICINKCQCLSDRLIISTKKEPDVYAVINKKSLVKYSDEDEWYQTFISHVATREACHYCRYTNLQRMSDITVGDFWGIEKFRLELECSKGISKVLLNTEKGKRLFEKISARVTKEKMELESAIRPNLKHPPNRSENREQFFEAYTTFGFYPSYKKYVENKISLIRKLKKWLKIKIKSMEGK